MGRLKHRDLARMAVRSLFLQATFNYERQQGLGWAWALQPALERLYPDPAERRERLAEHTAYFNTQPTLASLALGAVAGLEERRAAGEGPDAAAVARIKSVLGSSLAALGDRLFWFTMFTHSPHDGPVCTSAFARTYESECETLPVYFAYRQMTEQLLGKRLNGRILSGDAAKDRNAFLYEFEDPTTHLRTWVGWRNYYDHRAGRVSVKVPVRSLRLDTLRLDMAPRTSASVPFQAAADGWLQVALDSIPIYIRERSDALRPDLTIDSVWTAADSAGRHNPAKPSFRLWARIRNIGNGTFRPPARASRRMVEFYANGVDAGSATNLQSIPPQGTLDVSSGSTWTPGAPGDYLVKVVVNPGIVMEPDFDNNSGYRLCRVGAK